LLESKQLMHEAEIEIDPSVGAEIERASTLVPP
jgi:hypothetical protein